MSYRQRTSKHDQYVEQLVSQLEEENYDYISTHLKVKGKKRTVAEVDVLARKGSKLHIYEVKCSYRIVKAKKQLKRIKRVFSNEKVECYFYCGIGDKIEYV